MTATTIRVQMAQRKDTAANWTAANPILLSGEVGYETDTKKFKIGDGTTNWNSVAYLPIPDGSGNLTITGNLEIGTTGSLTFEGSTANGFETTLAVTDPTADRTITLPNVSGTVVTTGDTGSVTSTMIADGTIVNADISGSAEIAVSKLANGTANQVIVTDGTNVSWSDNLTLAGDLTVNGTTTTINTQDLLVEDKNIIIGNVATPTDLTADGGGITLKGSTDKTINWVDSTDAWTLSENVNIASGKEYRIDGTKVLDATSLGSGVVSSSLTSVGTIGTGVWQGTAIDAAYLDSTIVTTGDTGTVTSTMIADGTIVDGDVNASAAIAGTKISPNFGSQNVTTTGTATAAALIPTSSSVPTNGVYLPSSNNVAISTNGTGRLFVDANGNVGVGGASSNANILIEARKTASAAYVATNIVNLASNGYVQHLFNVGSTTGTNGSASISYAPGIFFQLGPSANDATSPIVFTNNNGSERMRLDSSGRLGLGTSNPGTILDARGIVSIGSANNSNAIIQKSAVPIGSFNLTITSGGGLTSESATTPTDALAGSVIKLLGGDPTTDTFGGGIQYYANGSTSPNGAGVGNQHVFYTRSAANTYTERLRIDSAGRVGIGTTSPNANLSLGSTVAAQKILVYEGASGGNNARYGFGIQTNEFRQFYPSDASLTFGTIAIGDGSTFSEKGRWDSSGRLLVGTSSSTGANSYTGLVVKSITSTNSPGEIILQNGYSNALNANSTLGSIVFQDGSGDSYARIVAEVDAQDSATGDFPGRLVFSVTQDGSASPTERVRISQQGTMGVFCTATTAGVFGTSAAAGTSVVTFACRHSASSTTAGTDAMYVYSNGNIVNTNNSYGAISDAKLKENIVDAGSQWSDLKALQVRKYNFKEGQTHTQIGLIAQEVELISPGLVSESPDRDAEGNDLGPVTKSVNYSVLYMKAVKALQEAMERIETLEAKVAALEGA